MSRHGRYNHPPFRQKGTDIERRGYTNRVISCVEGRSLESWPSTTSLPPAVLIVVSQPVLHMPDLSFLLHRNLDTSPGMAHKQVPTKCIHPHVQRPAHIYNKHTLVHRYTYTPIHIRVLGRKHSNSS